VMLSLSIGPTLLCSLLGTEKTQRFGTQYL
jgi:hypothetical protein